MATARGINPITGAPDRTTSSTRAEMIGDAAPRGLGDAAAVAQQVPLGFNPNVPMNRKETTVAYYARNHSSAKKRRLVKIAVNDSMDTFPDAVLKYWNLETKQIIERCRQGKDMNIYHEVVQPVRKALWFDGRLYVIEPGPPGEPGPWQLIPEGLWDLYLGNWERMHSQDAKAREQEILRVRTFVGNTPIVFQEGDPNPPPTAYIEFRRVEMDVVPVAAQNDLVFASDAVEV